MIVIKKYRDAISAKWNVHTAQIFGMLKRAVSFRPIVDIRKFITENVCDDTSTWLEKAAKALAREFVKIEKVKAGDFDNLDISVFETVQTAMRELKNSLDEHFYTLDKNLSAKRRESDDNAASIAKLTRGIKDYPQKLIRLKQRIDDALLTQYGEKTGSYILADLLEISDSAWQNAVEGYLNRQKFYILVEPAHYKTALHTLNSAAIRIALPQ